MIHIHRGYWHRNGAQAVSPVYTQSTLPAALFAVMEKAQRSGADGKRTRRKPGQQTEAALLTAATVVRVRLGLVVAFVL